MGECFTTDGESHKDKHYQPLFLGFSALPLTLALSTRFSPFTPWCASNRKPTQCFMSRGRDSLGLLRDEKGIHGSARRQDIREKRKWGEEVEGIPGCSTESWPETESLYKEFENNCKKKKKKSLTIKEGRALCLPAMTGQRRKTSQVRL